MQERHMDFNPLDLLATAAALKRHEPSACQDDDLKAESEFCDQSTQSCSSESSNELMILKQDSNIMPFGNDSKCDVDILPGLHKCNNKTSYAIKDINLCVIEENDKQVCDESGKKEDTEVDSNPCPPLTRKGNVENHLEPVDLENSEVNHCSDTQEEKSFCFKCKNLKCKCVDTTRKDNEKEAFETPALTDRQCVYSGEYTSEFEKNNSISQTEIGIIPIFEEKERVLHNVKNDGLLTSEEMMQEDVLYISKKEMDNEICNARILDFEKKSENLSQTLKDDQKTSEKIIDSEGKDKEKLQDVRNNGEHLNDNQKKRMSLVDEEGILQTDLVEKKHALSSQEMDGDFSQDAEKLINSEKGEVLSQSKENEIKEKEEKFESLLESEKDKPEEIRNEIPHSETLFSVNKSWSVNGCEKEFVDTVKCEIENVTEKENLDGEKWLEFRVSETKNLLKQEEATGKDSRLICTEESNLDKALIENISVGADGDSDSVIFVSKEDLGLSPSLSEDDLKIELHKCSMLQETDKEGESHNESSDVDLKNAVVFNLLPAADESAQDKFVSQKHLGLSNSCKHLVGESAFCVNAENVAVISNSQLSAIDVLSDKKQWLGDKLKDEESFHHSSANESYLSPALSGAALLRCNAAIADDHCYCWSVTRPHVPYTVTNQHSGDDHSNTSSQNDLQDGYESENTTNFPALYGSSFVSGKQDSIDSSNILTSLKNSMNSYNGEDCENLNDTDFTIGLEKLHTSKMFLTSAPMLSGISSYVNGDRRVSSKKYFKKTIPMYPSSPAAASVSTESKTQPAKISPLRGMNTYAHSSSPKIGCFKIGKFASISNIGWDDSSDTDNESEDAVSSCFKLSDNKCELFGDDDITEKNDYFMSLGASQKNYTKNLLLNTSNTFKDVSVKPTSLLILHDHDYCPAAWAADGLRISQTQSELAEELLSESKKIYTCDTHSSSEYNTVGSPVDSRTLRKGRSRLNDIQQLSEKVDVSDIDHLENVDAQKVNESKLKITGSFQDHYVYFLNKKIRSRRRFSHEILPDKNMQAKAFSDIVIPHLTDADIEALKRRRSHSTSATVNLASDLTACKSQLKDHPGEMSEFEHKLINTVLSMEGIPEDSDGNENVSLHLSSFSEGTVGVDGVNPEQLNLTPEQMDILFNAVKEVESSNGFRSSDEIVKEVAQSKDIATIDKSVPHSFLVNSSKRDLLESSDSGTLSTTTSELLKPTELNSDWQSHTCNDLPKPVLSNETHLLDFNENIPLNGRGLDLFDNAIPSGTKGNTVSDLSSIVVGSDIEKRKSTSSNNPQLDESASDLNSFCGHNSAAGLSDLSMPPLERQFDLFSSDLKLDKSDLFPDATVSDMPVTAADSNAPWIVTVTMYWNDLPAIMIDNQPYIRLVDIHKQILPAKDTGILKKRCQLLGLEVQNCTEFQRYFLVQYGRAYNSKSTLVIAKDDAKTLIGYYVDPHPRIPKAEGSEDERIIQEKKLLKGEVEGRVTKKQGRHRKQPNLHKMKSVDLHDNKQGPVNGVPETCLTFSTHCERSQRLRHKKINFLDLIRGESGTAEEKVDDNGTKSLGLGLQNCNEEKRVPKCKNYSKGKLTNAASESYIGKTTGVGNALLKKQCNGSSRAVLQSSSTRQHKRKNREANRHQGKRQKHVSSCLASTSANLKQVSKWKTTRNGHALKKCKPVPLKVKLKVKPASRKKVPNVCQAIEVLHEDAIEQSAQKPTFQAGELLLDLYVQKDSACIKCCTCSKMLTIGEFLKHQHLNSISSKLLSVSAIQCLKLRNDSIDSQQIELWKKFQKKQEVFERKVSTDDTHYFSGVCSVGNGLQNKMSPAAAARISSRKRKQKQFYPIENYDLKLIPGLQSRTSDTLMCDRACTHRSASKVLRFSLETPAIHKASSTSLYSNSLQNDSSSQSENVVTLQNGPELTSFTALENEFDN